MVTGRQLHRRPFLYCNFMIAFYHDIVKDLFFCFRTTKIVTGNSSDTPSRMDKYTPQLLDLGLGAMIGKGKRSQAVLDAIVRNGAVYFAAVGGAGALLSKRILSSEVIAYDDLGTEAVRRLEVQDFPVVVVVDCEGENLYEHVGNSSI